MKAFRSGPHGRRPSRLGWSILLAAVGLAGAGFAPYAPTKPLGDVASARPNAFAGAELYVDPASKAARQVASWRKSRPGDAAQLEKIAREPQALWVGDWNRDIRRDVDRAVTRMTQAGALPVLVAYNIPQRDCGLYSAGGARNAAAYRKWIRELAAGLEDRRAVVLLEPDGLGATRCLSEAGLEERLELFRDAVRVLKSRGAVVYIDAGNAGWLAPADIAGRLSRAGIAEADGFALNISNFHTNAASFAYGEKISRRVGGKHFVIDTSRNGLGPTADNQWCNPRGRALGAAPTVRTGHPLVDAFLWVKPPGDSDGTCNGGPRAGAWWPEDALGLAKRQPGQLALRAR